MKKSFRLIIEFDGGKVRAHVDSDPLDPFDCGIVFGKMGAIAESMKEQFVRSDTQHTDLFLIAFEMGRTMLPGEGSIQGFSEIWKVAT